MLLVFSISTRLSYFFNRRVTETQSFLFYLRCYCMLTEINAGRHFEIAESWRLMSLCLLMPLGVTLCIPRIILHKKLCDSVSLWLIKKYT